MIEDFPENPYAPPEAPLEIQHADSEVLRPIPFEDVDAIPAFWRRVGQMFQLLFQRPYELVDRVAVTESLGAPMRFTLLLSLPVTGMMVLVGILMGVLGGVMAGQARGGPPAGLFVGMGIFYSVLMPFMVLIGFFLGGLVNHAGLWLWGGLRQGRGLRQTLRLNGYYLAFFMLFYLVPLLNILLLLGGPAVLGLAMARLHRTNPWRGVCAAYMPLCGCCLGYAGLFGILAAMGQLK